MRRSRKFVAAAVAAIGALAVSAVAFAAQGDVIQNMDVKVSPNKLPKSDFQNAKLSVNVDACYEGTTAGQCDPAGKGGFSGPDTSRVVFQFDKKDVAFNTGEAKKCKIQGNTEAQAGALANLPPDQAVDACGRASKIGQGSATANAGGTDIPADVTAFNGKKKGGNPVVLLHAYAGPPFNTGTVPIGVLKPGNKLDVSVDPLVSGTARLEQFQVAIKKGAYVQARCTRGKSIDTTSKWTYRSAGDTTPTVEDSQSCQQKKGGGGGRN
jgi:hypothetical protein